MFALDYQYHSLWTDVPQQISWNDFFERLFVTIICKALWTNASFLTKNDYMKKLIKSLPRMFTVCASLLILSCGSPNNDKPNDTDRTEPGNGSNHSASGDTSMTDTTRNATSGMGNSLAPLSDTGFLTKNVIDNNMEIDLSKLGKSKSTDKQVKAVANQMIADHTQMLKDVKALAAKKHVTLPEYNTMPATDLGNATGKEFDKMWVQHMLTGHEAKLAELQSVINSTQDADIKALAGKALPKVQMHRDMLAKINIQ